MAVVELVVVTGSGRRLGRGAALADRLAWSAQAPRGQARVRTPVRGEVLATITEEIGLAPRCPSSGPPRSTPNAPKPSALRPSEPPGRGLAATPRAGGVAEADSH
ncbi:hypothetical protein ABT061_26310 [Streptosporangium sp. NPDC002544]|uniref:hypothetical protein n=1 Tax=Streptosporangium sp. NPDC002544 TaxID=3154538 RepID=UPI003318C7EF